MKQEDDKWIKAFRDRMKDHSEPVPADLWDSLEKELSPERLTPARPLRRLAVAAAVLFAVASSISFYYLFSPAGEYINNVPKIVVIDEPVSTDPVFIEPVLAEPGLTDVQPAIRKVGTVQLAETKDNDHQLIEEKEKATEVEETKEIIEIEEKNIEEKTSEKNAGNKQIIEKKRPYSGFSRTDDLLSSDFRSKRDKKWAVSLSMGNAPSTMNNNNVGFGSLSGGNNSEGLSIAMNSILADNIDVDIEELKTAESYKHIFSRAVRNKAYTDVKHKMPVTFGASFRYNLSKQFAIETGITYTLLSSELKSESEKGYYYVENQKLHYLGIPLKGNWTYLDRKYFSLYLSAGGAMEKSVYGKCDTDFIIAGKKDNEKTENLNVKPLQWSVSAAAGIQYNVTKHLGIYVEPGVVHYFDDGSSVQTIRKEKPTNFNLQMGFRLTY